MNDPLVTVAVPLYNHEQYIADTIKSIVNQKYKNIELIVIDDGSKDDSSVKVKELESICRERFVRFEFRSRANKGLCETLNEALSWAQGEFFTGLASDDVIFPEKIAIQVELFRENPSFTAIFGNVEIVDASGEVLKRPRGQEKIYSFKDFFLHEFCTYAPTQMVVTSDLKSVGGYPQSMGIEDWYMWLALTRNGAKVKVIGDVLAQYRRHENNLSSNAEFMHASRLKIINDYATHPLYRKAKSRCLYIAVEEHFSCGLFSDFDRLAWQAVRYNPFFLLNEKFIKLVFRRFFLASRFFRAKRKA